MTALAVVTGEIESPAEARLHQLASVIRREMEATEDAAGSMVMRAIACGDALLEAKTLVPPGTWGQWIKDTLPAGVRQAMSRNYMRLATLKEHVDPTLSITSNVQLVRGLAKRSAGTPRLPEETKREALRLMSTGEWSRAQVGRMVGTTDDTVHAWMDPEWAARRSQQMNDARRRRRLAQEPPAPKPPTTAQQRATRHGTPGRAAVGRAVRRLAEVQTSHQTHDALLDLIAVATAWADQLDVEGRR